MQRVVVTLQSVRGNFADAEVSVDLLRVFNASSTIARSSGTVIVAADTLL